jgi:hypothetical protein
VLSAKIDVETGSQKFMMAAAKTGCTCISASMQRSKEIPMAICRFLGLETTVALLVMLYLETGSEKFKMAAVTAEVPISQLQYKIPKKFILFSGSQTHRRHQKAQCQSESDTTDY